MDFYNRDLLDIYNYLNSSETGLKNEQISAKIEVFGENIIEKQQKIGFFKRLLNQFKNLMIIILIISALISIITSVSQNDTESLFEGLLIFLIVFVNAIIGVIQEQKAENALLALEKCSEPFAKVYRNNSLQKIRVKDIVPGDIIELKSGDIVPADIRLISCSNLKCNESSLTGESHSVIKNFKTINKQNLTISDQENICFSGTNVTSGSGKGIVFATGKNTEIGKIASIINTSNKEKTPLEKNIDKIGKVLTIGVLLIVISVFVIQLILNKTQSPTNAMLTAVALAVAAIPESLPAVITIIMALGVQKLAKKNAIIKKLSAVETLGSCNVICSDKTGTLTKNIMQVKHIYNCQEIIEDNKFDTDKNKTLINICAVCNNAIISNKKIVADATETAIINFLLSKNIDATNIKNQYKRLIESEFNSTKKTMSVICENQGEQFLFSKGAIDYILKNCKKIDVNGEILDINGQIRQKILCFNERVCNFGERVIAFAYRKINQFDKNKNYDNDLIFAGFFGIIDPPRSEAKKSVKECRQAGLKVIMITGDHPSTALSIAKKLNIAKSKKEVLTGSEISKLTEYELSKIIKNYSVFARVTPEHKLMIVKALKKSNNVVAMTGDGVNDAPSIKQADIGLCMGITGTDVTKEVADIIISDDNFSTIVLAIKEGRTIYQNIKKTILFLLSTNIVEVLGIFIASLIIPEAIFLSPTQILFINLVTDSLPAFALGIEPPEKDIMNEPPRNASNTILSGKTGSSIIYQGFIQSLIVLVMFISAKYRFGNEVANTMSFLTICFMQIIHAINCKSEKSIFKTNIFNNRFFNISFILLVGLILGVYFTPFFAQLFDIVVLNKIQWALVISTSISIIPLVEFGKLIIKN